MMLMRRMFMKQPLSSIYEIGAFSRDVNKRLCSNTTSYPQKLSHVKSDGSLHMVNVGSKQETTRVAVASCCVKLCENAFNAVLTNTVKKGDVLTVAKIAGIMGAKRTSDLIPLCHPIAVSKVDVELLLNKERYSVDIHAEVCCTGRTGVEMEALTAASVAGLTVYDMCKSISHEICITDIQLQQKSGGKRDYKKT